MATAVIVPEPRRIRGFWARVSNIASSAWNWTMGRASTAWTWTKVKGASLAAWSVRAARFTVTWVKTHVTQLAGFIAFSALWLVRGVFRGIGMLGYAASWIVTTLVSIIATVLAFLGTTGVFIVFGLAVVLLFASGLWSNYVAETFRWMASSPEGRLGLRAHLKARRAARRAEVSSSDAIDTEDDIVVPAEITPGHPLYRADLEVHDFNDTAYTPARVFHLNHETGADKGPGELLHWDDDVSRVPGNYPILTNLHRAGVRIPVTVDWSAHVANHDPMLRETMMWLMDKAPTKREKSYWAGRIKMIELEAAAPDSLAHLDQMWALTNKQLQSHQAQYNMKYLKGGFYDMATELQRSANIVTELVEV